MEFNCVITHKKSKCVLAANTQGNIILEYLGEYVCEIALEDIGYVKMIEPGFFQSGYISFWDSDGDPLVYQAGSLDIRASIEVSRKEKDNFYLMYEIFNQLGLKIKLL